MDGKVVADMVHETTHSTFELLKAVELVANRQRA